jgi:hypothetical protein
MDEVRMFFLNITFCSVALVLLALVAVEAESLAARGHMLADAEIALKQPIARTAQVRGH